MGDLRTALHDKYYCFSGSLHLDGNNIRCNALTKVIKFLFIKNKKGERLLKEEVRRSDNALDYSNYHSSFMVTGLHWRYSWEPRAYIISCRFSNTDLSTFSRP